MHSYLLHTGWMLPHGLMSMFPDGFSLFCLSVPLSRCLFCLFLFYSLRSLVPPPSHPVCLHSVHPPSASSHLLLTTTIPHGSHSTLVCPHSFFSLFVTPTHSFSPSDCIPATVLIAFAGSHFPFTPHLRDRCSLAPHLAPLHALPFPTQLSSWNITDNRCSFLLTPSAHLDTKDTRDTRDS